MQITEDQQKLYELAKAEKLLEKHNILEASQKQKIKNEKDKILDSKNK